MISKFMGETLTNKSCQEMCKMIAMEFPRALKEIQEHPDDNNKKKSRLKRLKNELKPEIKTLVR
jgi:hypothetical protein